MRATKERLSIPKPPCARRSAGMPYLQPRNTPLALTSRVRSQTDSSVDTASSSFECMMPALLKSTFSLPKAFSAAATIAWQSAAFETSARTAMPLPICFMVSWAVFSSRSTATICAPSLAKRSAAWRPMPLPAPVMRATLSLSLIGRESDPFEVSLALPVRDGLVIGRGLGAIEVSVVFDDVLAEGALGELARGEELDRLGKRPRHVLAVLRHIDVADEPLRRLGLARDALQAGGERGGKREVRIAIRARDAAFDAHRRSVADHAEAGGAVVVAPGEARRRPRRVDVALVRIDGRRIEDHQLGHARHPAAEEPAEELAVLLEHVLRVAPQADVDVAARARLVGGELGHEGERQAGGIGQLLQALLEDHVPVGHVERAGVAHVHLVLAVAPFALGGLDRHAGQLEVAAHRGVEALGACALQDVIVLEVPAGGLEVAVSLQRRVAVAGAEEVVLELSGCERFKSKLL